MWWRSDALYENLKQTVFIDGEVATNVYYNYFQFDNQINKNINASHSFFGAGINYELTKITPVLDQKFNENPIKLDRYLFNNLEVYGHYVYNNLNSVFYATKGNYFKGSVGRSFVSEVDLNYYQEEEINVTGETNGHTKVTIEFEKRIPFTKKITGIIGANGNFIFEDKLKSDEISFSNFGLAQKYFLGGNLPNQRKNSLVFPGLHEDELNVDQLMKLNLGVQFNPVSKLYFIPHFDIATVRFGNFKSGFLQSGNWEERDETSTLISAGATFSYHSFLGPVNFDFSWVNDINKVRVFFSIGLILN